MKGISLKDMKIKMKIVLIVVTAIIVSIGVVGGYALYTTISQAEADIAAFESDLMEGARAELKDLVDTAYTVVEKSHSQSATVDAIKAQYGGQLSDLVGLAYTLMEEAHAAIDPDGILSESERASLEAEARKDVKEAIRWLRYGRDGYFWMNDTVPRVVMHPIVPSLEGRDMGDFKRDGKLVLAEGTQTPLYKQFVKLCRSNPDRDGLVNGLRARGHRHVTPLESAEALPHLIHDLAEPGDLVVCLGAGNITAWANALPGQLQKLITAGEPGTDGPKRAGAGR